MEVVKFCETLPCGVGRMLLDHLESFVAKQGINRLHLTSTPLAVMFYKPHGWKRGREVPSTF